MTKSMGVLAVRPPWLPPWLLAVKRDRRTVQVSSVRHVWPECLTPTVMGSSGSVMPWGTFWWHGLGPLVPLQGRVTANQYKVVLSDHLHPMMKHLYPDGSGLFQDDNAPIHRAGGVTEWFDVYENDAIYCHMLRLS